MNPNGLDKNIKKHLTKTLSNTNARHDRIFNAACAAGIVMYKISLL